MASLEVPDSGLTLCRVTNAQSTSSDTPPKPNQVMRLNLAQNTLEELLKSLRQNEKARIRFGKREQTIHYGNKSQHVFSRPEPTRPELYLGSADDKANLYFSGTLSHSLEVQKAQEATAATDEALETLTQSLNAFKEQKESHTTMFITDTSKLPPEKGPSRKGPNSRPNLQKKDLFFKHLDLQKERLLNVGTIRSMPTSPSLSTFNSPAVLPSAVPPTSAPQIQSKEKAKLEALRVSLIHLLAVRPVSAKFLAQQTRSSKDDCMTLVQKYGKENNLNREKWDLKDKPFKDLDVWNFPYPSQEDRQEAIDHAISAFDRLRVPRQDKLWQMLLPKAQRGKGTILSRLDFSGGPRNTHSTPRISVQKPDNAGRRGDISGHDSDAGNSRLTPNASEPMARSRSQDPITKKKVSEKEAYSRRLLSNKPNKTAVSERGRATQSGEKRPSAKASSKFKSSEYVDDSDDSDVEMVDAPGSNKAEPKPTPGEDLRPKVSKGSQPVRKDVNSGPKVTKHKPQLSISSTLSSPPGRSDSNESIAADTRKGMPRPQTDSSPPKPSPLGSSPPTNASDFDRSSKASVSSTSSSPLVSQARNQNTKAATDVRKHPSQSNGTHPPNVTSANTLKRKAEHFEDSSSPQRSTTGHAQPNTAKRRRSTSPEPRNTDLLERKANHVDQRSVQDSRPLTNGATPVNPSKNHPSSSSPDDGTSSDSSSPPLNKERLSLEVAEKVSRFKKFWAKYQALHTRLSAQTDVPASEIEGLERMHNRLDSMKKEIWEDHKKLGELT